VFTGLVVRSSVVRVSDGSVAKVENFKETSLIL